MSAAPAADAGQKWLVDCLSATLDARGDVRSFAESALHQASLHPGFGCALAKMTVHRDIQFGLRQLAAVLLKQFIKQHWQEDEEGFIHPAVSAEEKCSIRHLLLPSLNDSHGKIRTAVGMTIASIAQYDWPEEWPELLPFLLKLISDENDIDGVRGSLRCLALLSGDLDDTLVPKLVPALFPYLLKIISSFQLYDKSLRTKALAVLHSCISVLASMSASYKTETRDLIYPFLGSMMEHFTTILRSPVQSENPDEWGIRMEVLKCLLQFVQNFSNLMEAHFYVITGPLWETFISSLVVYEQSSIRSCDDPSSGRYDSDGTEISLESFIIQIHAWSMDANQFVADEDDATYSCRVSGSLLLEEIVNAYGVEGINSIIEAAQKRFIESSQAKLHSVNWWRIHEASLFALVSISVSLVEALTSGLLKYSIADLLEQILIEDMERGSNEYPFLLARTFSVAAKFSSLIDKNLSQKFLFAAIQSLNADVLPPVKVGACCALSLLLPECSQDFIQPHLKSLLLSLTDLLMQASDETLHLVLETLLAAINKGDENFISIEPLISPVILRIWEQHISDPFISIDVLDVLEAIKNSPGCMWPLVSRILPSLHSVLENPRVQRPGLVAGSLDLLTMLLKAAPLDLVKTIHGFCFSSVIFIILASDDHTELQNATECLASFISGSKQDLLAWDGDPGLSMKRLLDAASRLLDPHLENSGSLFVGTYILQLILHLPSQMAPHIRELVVAVVRRLQSCEIAGLRSSLILILARLVHLSSPNIGQFVSLLLTMNAEGHENSFSYIMSEWVKQQVEILGAYQIKVTTTALALLLSTCYVELAKINVEGHLLKLDAGIVTRSKAKLIPEQWTMIPLPTKIFSLLADTLVEIQEQVLAGNEEDSDWEEASDGDTDLIEGILCSASLSTNTKPSDAELDAMAKVYNEGDDESTEAQLYKTDPLYEVNLADYLTNFFHEFSRSDRPFFNHLCQSLTIVQRRAIEIVLPV